MPLYNRLPLKLLKKTAYKYASNTYLVPHLNVASEVKDGKRYWQAINDDPQFILKKKNGATSFGSGWYMLRFRLFSHQSFEHAANVYIDYGNGFNENDVIKCNVTGNRLATIIIKLSAKAKHIRFDPVSKAGEFRIDEFRLVRLPAYLAKHYIAKLLMTQKVELSKMSTAGVLTTVRADAKKQALTADSHLLGLHHSELARTEKGIAYDEWIQNLEKSKFVEYKKEYKLPAQRPLVSVIMPVYNTEPELLRQTLESVISQSYSHWELCIADDASDNQATVRVLTEYVDKYPNQIKLHRMAQNSHISLSSNAAMALASGEFCLLLDHDDLLSKDAIDCLIRQLSVHPDAKILYADEDKVTLKNKRHSAHFKADWNQDLLFSQNYICHPLMIHKSILDEIGGFRTGIEGSQDHDLILRASAKVEESSIRHVPLILYHWRESENSTASSSDAKSYTTDAGIKSLEDYFLSKSLDVSVTMGKFPNTYHCRWPLPDNTPLVSLIIPTKDAHDILKQCVDSILELTTYPNYEIIIVDNQTTCKRTLALFDRLTSNYKNIRIIKWDAPFNYSAINNFAVANCSGEVIGLINNDIEVISSSWLEEMVSHAIRPEIGCVGAKLYYPNDTVQHAGVILGLGGVAGHAHKYLSRQEPGYFSRAYLTQNLSAVTAAALVVRKQTFLDVGGLNEVELKIAFNDVDFCLKVREAGYKNVFTPWAELYHHESLSRGQEDSPEKIARFNSEVNYMKKRWGKLLNVDPAYNPNLSLQFEDFSLNNGL